MGSAGKSLKAEAKAFAVWFWFEAIRRGLCLNYMKMITRHEFSKHRGSSFL